MSIYKEIKLVLRSCSPDGSTYFLQIEDGIIIKGQIYALIVSI